MSHSRIQSGPLAAGLLLTALFVVSSFWAINALVAHEERRDYDDWRLTLGVVADQRAALVEQWLAGQSKPLQQLAANGSTQLYIQHLTTKKSSPPQEVEPAQLSYLRNLLHAVAERHDFMDQERSSSPLQANIAFQANRGIGLFDRNLRLLTATPGVTTPDQATIQQMQETLASGLPGIRDVHLNTNGMPVLGFILPVHGLQGIIGSQEVTGLLYGFKPIDSLFPLLASSTGTIASGETLLVRRDGSSITYLSPLADGASPLKRHLAANDPHLAAARALQEPGSFNELKNYNGQEVLFTSRTIDTTDWVLLHTITKAEALKESKTHQRFLRMILLVATLLVMALLAAFWYFGTSSKLQRTAFELRKKSTELQEKSRLLAGINNNIQDFILLADKEQRFLFGNAKLCDTINQAPADIVGKTISSILGAPQADLLGQPIRKALLEGPGSTIFDLELNGRIYHLHALFTPLAHDGSNHDAVLVTLHDLTTLQEAQDRRDNLMRQLVKGLMSAIDLHDPYSANHSAKTADIAVAVGRTLGFAKEDLATVETAANLCNLGKLFIPKDILTKTGTLSDVEMDFVKKEPRFAAKILNGIDFEGPVRETILQKHENMDGSGYPMGIQGDEILITAKVLSVSNAFVAMISPRAYRDGLSVEEALDQILKSGNTEYDRKVIAALFQVAENEIEWHSWKMKNEED